MTIRVLHTPHGELPLPAFLPDATRGAVRSLEPAAVAAAGVRGLMMNAFHLARRPGAQRVKKLGGIHAFSGWNGPIVTDSGGFQVLSLIRSSTSLGKVRPGGVLFRSEVDHEKIWLTPENSVQAQLRLGSDVLIALDECTHPTDPPDAQRGSVERTLRWFRAARRELDQLVAGRPGELRPKLVGVAQGGADGALRTACIDGLLEAGADAVGFGGWPVDETGALLFDMVALLAERVPADRPLFALGIGKPEHLVALSRLTPRFVFDCTLPTRDARHHRLYAFEPGWQDRLPLDFYHHVHILDAKYAAHGEPIDETCDCELCRNHPAAFLHHLFKSKDGLADRLATLHNVRFYARLVDHLGAVADGARGVGST